KPTDPDKTTDPDTHTAPEEQVVTKAGISLMQAADISKESMCDGLFYPEADLVLNGDGTATVTLYCINPIPGFASAGEPLTTMLVSGLKSDVTITGTGAQDYQITAGADSFAEKAEIRSDAGDREYAAYGAFIPMAGTYSSDSFTFTLPLSAIRNSGAGAIYVNAYVNAVMSSWQSFYLVFDVDEDFGKTDETVYGAYAVETPGLTGASVSGLKAYAERERKGEYLFHLSVATASEETDKFGMAACAELISASGVEGNTQYYSMLLSYTNEDGTTYVTDTGSQVLDISIPLKDAGNQKVAVYRHHAAGKATGALTEALARPSSKLTDNTWYWDKTENTLHIYASKFSVYAVHVSTQSSAGGTGGNGSGNGGSGQVSGGNTGSGTTTETESASYTAKVSMRKITDFNSTSMCDTLFYEYADLEVNGDSTKLTLYVIDPIPKYASEGTPLSNINFKTSSGTTAASLSTSQVSRYFAADGSFIESSGNYYSDPITVTLPTSALRNSTNRTVICSAYVNAVMKSTQEFYVVLTDWTKGETESKGEATKIDTTGSTAQSLTASGTMTGTGTTAAGTTSSVETGVYQVPISALKEKSDDASMMNDYMYKYAQLTVTEDDAKLTLYVQHTVAGIEAGGPKYLSYKSVKADKQENAVTFDGVSYDSFTITLANPVPNILPVTMYVNAMSMEVNARLVLDLDAMTETEGLDGDGGTALTSAKGTASAGGASTDGAKLSGLRLGASSTILKVMLALIVIALLALGGTAAYLRYRRRI
ncbi:MAG: NEAT domain-containing protein, partial [Eubacteriales bacterium]|nr:NEAT domain-containing protein [Eubacteriales bacterium]